jgi:hypothetical protein
MLLDDLPWSEEKLGQYFLAKNVGFARVSAEITIVRTPDDRYTIYKCPVPELIVSPNQIDSVIYRDLEPLVAQAILYELTSGE